MLPDIWGKHGWSFLHFVTLGYPDHPTDEDKIKYYHYFHALKNVLPCTKCCYNMHNHLDKYPLTDEVLSSRRNLVKWGIDLHNVVNYYNGKKMLSYPEAMNELSKLTYSNHKNYSAYFYLFALVIIIIVCYLFYHIYTRKN